MEFGQTKTRILRTRRLATATAGSLKKARGDRCLRGVYACHSSFLSTLVFDQYGNVLVAQATLTAYFFRLPRSCSFQTITISSLRGTLQLVFPNTSLKIDHQIRVRGRKICSRSLQINIIVHSCSGSSVSIPRGW